MHENLKYTLRLNKDIKEFTSFDNINRRSIQAKENIGDWQPLYSDIKYGTHYFIYTKFLGEINTKENDEFVINKIQLYIQNYSGPVSIGFNGYVSLEPLMEMEEDDPDNKDPRYENRNKYYLKIGLEGFRTDEKTQNLPNDRFPNLDIKLKKGDILVTQPFFTPINPTLSRIYEPKEINNSNFVDELFMERTGDDIFITPKGKSQLTELFHLDCISEENLLSAGINLTNEEVNKTISEYRSYKESKGIKYPCRPESCFFILE